MLHRFSDRYYVLNTLFVLSYIPIRLHIIKQNSTVVNSHDPYFGIPKEAEIILMTLFFIASKYRKCATMDAFIPFIFLYSNIGQAALYYYIGIPYFFWYSIVAVILFLTLRPPKYTGPEFAVDLNPEMLDRRILKKPKEDKIDITWVVYFYADWCDASRAHDPLFAALSLKYNDTSRLKFAKVDIVRYPELAEKYAIDQSPSAHQLPTFILFKKGKETSRLPPFNSEGKVVKTIMDQKGIEAVFNLDSF